MKKHGKFVLAASIAAFAATIATVTVCRIKNQQREAEENEMREV